jgi:FG-GAP-like repeat
MDSTYSSASATRPFHSLLLFALGLIAWNVLAIAPAAQATMKFSDSFAYPVGPLASQGPPTGRPAGQTGWFNANGSAQLTTPGLAFPNVASAGNKAEVTGVSGANGDIATANLKQVGGGTSIVWAAFLINEASGGAAPNGYSACSFGGGAVGPSFGMILNTNLYGIDNNTGLAGNTAVTSIGPSAATMLFVIKFDFAAGREYLWINPTTTSAPNTAQASASLAMTPAFQSSGFNQVMLSTGFNTASFNYDEVRVATAFDEVVPVPRFATSDFNQDGIPDYVLFNPSTRATAIWFLDSNNRFQRGAYGPVPPVGWTLAGVGDMNGDGMPDYVLLNPNTHQTALWYFNNNGQFDHGVFSRSLPAGWAVVAAVDMDGDGNADYVLSNPSTHQTAVWYSRNEGTALERGVFSHPLPIGWTLVGAADFDGDGNPDFLLFNPSTSQVAIWYLDSNGQYSHGVFFASGHSLPAGWILRGTADFDGDGNPDLLLINPATRQTAIWYLKAAVYNRGALGPALAIGYTLVSP